MLVRIGHLAGRIERIEQKLDSLGDRGADAAPVGFAQWLQQGLLPTTSHTHARTTTGSNAGRFDAIIASVTARHGVDPDLVHAVIRAESNYNPECISSAGARGLMQLMPGTARHLGVADSFDPEQNIDGGVRYLKQQIERFGDLRLALAAYNAGPGAVVQYGGIPPYRETQAYVPRVMRYYHERKSATTGTGAATSAGVNSRVSDAAQPAAAETASDNSQARLPRVGAAAVAPASGRAVLAFERTPAAGSLPPTSGHEPAQASLRTSRPEPLHGQSQVSAGVTGAPTSAPPQHIAGGAGQVGTSAVNIPSAAMLTASVQSPSAQAAAVTTLPKQQAAGHSDSHPTSLQHHRTPHGDTASAGLVPSAAHPASAPRTTPPTYGTAILSAPASNSPFPAPLAQSQWTTGTVRLSVMQATEPPPLPAFRAVAGGSDAVRLMAAGEATPRQVPQVTGGGTPGAVGTQVASAAERPMLTAPAHLHGPDTLAATAILSLSQAVRPAPGASPGTSAAASTPALLMTLGEAASDMVPRMTGDATGSALGMSVADQAVSVSWAALGQHGVKRAVVGEGQKWPDRVVRQGGGADAVGRGRLADGLTPQPPTLLPQLTVGALEQRIGELIAAGAAARAGHAAAGSEPRQISIELSPPELGRVHLSLALDDRGANLHVRAESMTVAMQLDSSLRSLEGRLEQLGIRLAGLQVTCDGSGGSALGHDAYAGHEPWARPPAIGLPSGLMTADGADAAASTPSLPGRHAAQDDRQVAARQVVLDAVA